MKEIQSILISRKIYSCLLFLYPKAHKNEYGPDMLQVFTDQCYEAYKNGKKLSLIPLWLRTLGDLVVNVFKEHVSDPQSALGLMEAAPHSPLPWKGVFLVLVPGLIFFISQVAQLNGEDWFFLMVYRAAYVLIIPVLIVWVWKRKFPIWGLVPLGLLFKTLFSYWYRMQFLILKDSNSILFQINEQTKAMLPSLMNQMLTITFLLSILALLWLAKRRSAISKAAWVWLSVYSFLCLFLFLSTCQNVFLQMGNIGDKLENPAGVILELAFNEFFNYGGFLVLILMGTLLAKRHGRMAVLLPLGYLLPTIIYGRISNDWPDMATPEFSFMLSVAAAALVYRFIVALAAPMWIIRSASGKMQKRAEIISMTTLLLIQLIFNLSVVVTNDGYGNWFYFFGTAIYEQLIIGAGLALAISLYGNVPQAQKVEQPMDLALEGPTYS